MSVRIRMSRTGRKNRPYFRISACDSRVPRNGRTLEILGHYDPLIRDDTKKIVVKKERIEHWVSQGAIPSLAVVSLLKPLQIKWKNKK